MKILVPTDFSDNANNALDFAKAVAKREAAKITLFFAYYAVYDFAAQATEIIATIEHDAENALKKASKEAIATGLEVDYKLQYGSVATGVTSFAYQQDYNLIVMGTQGASGIKKAVMGSNTGHVIKDSMLPVLAVPASAKFEKLSKISLALELIHEEEQFFDKLFALTEKLGMQYEFFHVQTTDSFERAGEFERVKKLLEVKYPQFPVTMQNFKAKNLSEGIDAFLQANPDSLLVMFYKNKTFFEYLFNQSDSLEMAYHTHVPLLVVK
jgi:nucleotide-binding universal stress UspA family protein